MSNRYQQAFFLTSVPDISHAPADTGSEVAFAGRSNAGKSSALNVLCNQKALARTSKTPGRTQQINFFALDDDHRLVDLPGYGYAKVPIKMKLQWQAALGEYLDRRTALKGLILLMDCRHPLTDFDQQMLAWAAQAQLATHILLTKVDKLNRGAAQNTLLQVRKQLPGIHPAATVQAFSSTKRVGLEEARGQLDCWLYEDTAE